MYAWILVCQIFEILKWMLLKSDIFEHVFCHILQLLWQKTKIYIYQQHQKIKYVHKYPTHVILLVTNLPDTDIYIYIFKVFTHIWPYIVYTHISNQIQRKGGSWYMWRRKYLWFKIYRNSQYLNPIGRFYQLDSGLYKDKIIYWLQF